MSTIISLQTILWSALAAAAGIGLPVLVFLVWKFKFCRGAKLFPVLIKKAALFEKGQPTLFSYSTTSPCAFITSTT